MRMLDASNLVHLPLDALRTFVAASELASFTRAGEEVHRSQSAVSMQMKRLEEELGCRLFERNARRVCLTSEGATLLGYARRMLQLHDEALAALAIPVVEGEVRLGVPDEFATSLLPGVLARFARTHPMVRVVVRCDATRALLRLLTTRELDVCICTCDNAPENAEVLLRNPLVWAASRQMAIDLDSGAPLPLAVFHEGCLYRHWALRTLEQAGIPHRIAYSSPSLAAILAAVRSGFAIAPVALSSVAKLADFRILGPESGLPALPSVGVTLHTIPPPFPEAVAHLVAHVRDGFASSEPTSRLPASCPSLV